MKWLNLPVKVLKCVSHSWVYMSKFWYLKRYQRVRGFGEICLNLVFSVVVIKSVYGVYIVILTSSLFGVFSRGSLVK